jgi:hypothetical protein
MFFIDLNEKKSGEKIALTHMFTFAYCKKVDLVYRRVGTVAGAAGAASTFSPGAGAA